MTSDVEHPSHEVQAGLPVECYHFAAELSFLLSSLSVAVPVNSGPPSEVSSSNPQERRHEVSTEGGGGGSRLGGRI